MELSPWRIHRYSWVHIELFELMLSGSNARGRFALDSDDDCHCAALAMCGHTSPPSWVVRDAVPAELANVAYHLGHRDALRAERPYQCVVDVDVGYEGSWACHHLLRRPNDLSPDGYPEAPPEGSGAASSGRP